MFKKAIAEACKKAGGQSALARYLGCTPQAVQRMYSTGRVPATRVLAVESLTGVSRYALRPDIFGVLPQANCAAPSIFPFIPCHDAQAEVGR